MIRMFLFATVLSLPSGFVAPVPPSDPPAAGQPWEVPFALRELDRQPRTGAVLDPADPFCGTPGEVTASLVDDYGEQVVGITPLPGGRLLEFWASSAAGSWTLVYHRPDGIACVADWGDGWTPLAKPHPLMGSPGVNV